MSMWFKIFSGIAAIWSGVYSVSFAIKEIKNKRFAGGLTSLASVITMTWAYIKSIGF